MKAFFFIFAILLFFRTPTWASIHYKENQAYQRIVRLYRFNHTAMVHLHPLLSKNYGLSYRLGYSLGQWSVDIGGEYAQANFGTLSSRPGLNEFSSSESGDVLNQTDSEINRARNADDPWSRMLIEVGVKISGRLIPLEERRLAQFARFSLAYAIANDQLNQLKFAGFLLGTEFGVSYLLAQDWFLNTSLTYRFGTLYRTDVPKSNARSLPFDSLQLGLSVSYYIP